MCLLVIRAGTAESRVGDGSRPLTLRQPLANLSGMCPLRSSGFRPLWWIATCALLAVPAAAETVTVFAAASLSGALHEFWPPDRHPDIRLSFAGSSALARQIEAGAPADLYLSASSAWMDYLQTRGSVDSTTRFDLLGNRLVIIAPRGEGFALAVDAGTDIGRAFPGRLAVGDPDHVPAGVYAQQALQALGWWSVLIDRLAPASDVRGAVAWVARGECAAGIAYATDVISSPGIELVATFADSLHAPIRYPAALVSGRISDASRRRLDTLRSPAARAVFRRHGFITLTAPE